MSRLGIPLLLASAAGVYLFAPTSSSNITEPPSASTSPGVVFEMEITDHSESPPVVYDTEIMAEGANYKMSMTGGPGGGMFEMIFRGDRREMLMVSHEERSYFVMNQETIAAMAGMFAKVAEMMERMPEAQRDAMMKAQGMGGAEQTELRNTGDKATRQGYPCVKYEVLRGGHVIREMWVTDWDNVDGGDEAYAALEGMVSFVGEMMESFKGFGPMAEMGNEFDKMKEMNGLPVESREFDDSGTLTGESRLKSASRKAIDEAEFEPPAGYKKQDMGRGF
ncbi:MAG: hypothetical protein V3U67_08100 [Gemmatimonadota bacterium]